MKSGLIAFLCLFSFQFAQAGKNEFKLDLSKPIKEVVAEADTILGDGNISTGTSAIGFVTPKESLRGPEAYNIALFRTVFAKRLETKLPDGVKLTTSTLSLNTASNEISYDLAEANAFSLDKCPREKLDKLVDTRKCRNLKDLKFVVNQLYSKLVQDGGLVNIVRTTAQVENDSDNELRNVTLTSLYNTKTNELIYVFTIEGRM